MGFQVQLGGGQQYAGCCWHEICPATPRQVGKGVPALLRGQCGVRPGGQKDSGRQDSSPSFSSCPSSPHILPPPQHPWPGSDRTQQTGKDALTAKKCSESRLNPNGNLRESGLGIFLYSARHGLAMSSQRSCFGCEIRSGSLLSAPTRKEAKGFAYPLRDISGVSCISAVTSFPLTGFPQTPWKVPSSKPH